MPTITYERRTTTKHTLELTLPAYIAYEDHSVPGRVYSQYTVLLSDGRVCTVTQDTDADGTEWMIESRNDVRSEEYRVFDPDAPKRECDGEPSTAEVFKAKFAAALTAIGPIA